MCICFVSFEVPVRALADSRTVVNAEFGPEFDSNALRSIETNTDKAIQAGLLRLSADASLRWRSDRWLGFLEYGAGGKLFLKKRANASDELVQKAGISLGRHIGSQSLLSAVVSYYDAFQRSSLRDFRSGKGGIRFQHLFAVPKNLILSCFAGYRGLQFKPDERFAFHSAVLNAVASIQPSSSELLSRWSVTTTYRLALRAYRGRRIGAPEPCASGSDQQCQLEQADRRFDHNHLMRIGVTYDGPMLARLWYAAESNNSNSYGESYWRHVLGLKFTSELVWGVLFSVLGVIQISEFSDPLFSRVATQSFVSIEDENRSRLTLYLSRAITEYLSIGLRYSLFVNEAGQAAGETVPPGFLRHTLFSGLSVHWE